MIPEKLVKVAERAQNALEQMPIDQRVAFIKKKSHVWRAFKRHLRAMSYGKCWYSEAMGPQSPYDVDHFRPKSEAQRADNEKDDGYPWLAFDWDNFRYSAERSNRLSTDEETGQTFGKSSWFPLVPNSPIACWDNRCTKQEKPLLLDPTRKADVALIDVGSDGRMIPSKTCTQAGKERVKASVRFYGLDLPDILAARRQVMIDLGDEVDKLLLLIADAMEAERAGDPNLIEMHRKTITGWTLPNRPFTLAARARLIELGLPELLAGPEDQLAIAA
ncbi:MAG: hypothetical protein WC729_16550 [Sphingomonas sp.]|jgi:hypothetical protein|uniref:hypothetical protein n=1 Tax=Sphingomonas sp. TaxID=28214 RepID=UPI003561A995